MKSSPIYIALGGNIPHNNRAPRETISDALSALERAGIEIVERSSDWNSPAWPDPADPAYVNATARIETDLPPRRLLDLMHRVETDFGRTRAVRWASRTLDLDLIDYRGRELTDPDGMEIPHPRAAQRAFVLLPLQEIAGDWREPGSGRHIADLIARLDPVDLDAMKKLQSIAV